MNRIYVVTDTQRQPVHHRLVRAASQAQARNFAARTQYAVDVAGQQTLIDLLGASVQVEDAGATAILP